MLNATHVVRRITHRIFGPFVRFVWKRLAPGFIRRRHPTVYSTTKGNLKSQCFFSKNNSLHTYVDMYSISTESHMPRDGRILIYDPYRYYHFFKKRVNLTGPFKQKQKQDNNYNNSLFFIK